MCSKMNPKFFCNFLFLKPRFDICQIKFHLGISLTKILLKAVRIIPGFIFTYIFQNRMRRIFPWRNFHLIQIKNLGLQLKVDRY